MIRRVITEQVSRVAPYDGLEADHQAATLAWIASGADLFRVQKPDVPPQHLVAYFVMIDPNSYKLLLQDHVVSGLPLPPGGHVESDEHLIDTIKRECQEELGIEAKFFGEPRPHFVTMTKTNDKQGAHTDVSLWYLLEGDESTELALEKGKVHGVQWWQLDHILQAPIEQFDPHFHRFCNKITPLLNALTSL